MKMSLAYIEYTDFQKVLQWSIVDKALVSFRDQNYIYSQKLDSSSLQFADQCL